MSNIAGRANARGDKVDAFNPEDYLTGEEKVILWDALHALKHSSNEYERKDLEQVIRALNDLAATRHNGISKDKV